MRPRHCRSGRLSNGWQDFAGGAGILGDLGRQLVDTGKFAFGAKEGFQAYRKTLSVEVRLLVEQMGLAQHAAILDRRADAYIGDPVAEKRKPACGSASKICTA